MNLTEAPTRAVQAPGTALLQSGLPQEALPFLLEAQKNEPQRWEHLVNLGIAYRMMGDWANASAYYTKAIQVAPEHPAVWYNVAVLCEDFGHFADAAQVIDPLYQQFPMHQQICLLYAQSWLRRGDWKEAWSAWEVGRYHQSWEPIPNLPVWTSEPLYGKRLLVLCEGGYGDAFLFQRYFRLLSEAGVSVFFYLWDNQIPVFDGHPHIAGFVRASEGANPREYDYQIPLLSLPRRFSAGPAEVPLNEFVPHGEPVVLANSKQPRIGLCWAAEENGVTRKVRSVPCQMMEILRGTGDCHAVFPSQEAPEWVTRHSLKDWRDTVRLIRSMDVVVSVDTAVAHLAAMLGKETFIILPPSSDWKWLLGRDDTVWYPTARVFRTAPTETFENTLQRVAEALRGRV